VEEGRLPGVEGLLGPLEREPSLPPGGGGRLMSSSGGARLSPGEEGYTIESACSIDTPSISTSHTA
jgi:hypothetical protein